MKMPNKGEMVYVEGYGSAIFAGATGLDKPNEAKVGLKYEGVGLDEGYGNGIIWINYNEFDQSRVYPEQVPAGQPTVKSDEKAVEILKERL